jgi:hypothetical protein
VGLVTTLSGEAAIPEKGRAFTPSAVRMGGLFGAAGAVGLVLGHFFSWAMFPDRVTLFPITSVEAVYGAVVIPMVVLMTIGRRSKFAIVVTPETVTGPSRLARRLTLRRDNLDLSRTRAQASLECRLGHFMIWDREGRFIRVVRRWHKKSSVLELSRLLLGDET